MSRTPSGSKTDRIHASHDSYDVKSKATGTYSILSGPVHPAKIWSSGAETSASPPPARMSFRGATGFANLSADGAACEVRLAFVEFRHTLAFMSDGLTIGLIGGTGLGQALGATEGRRHEVATPYGRPSDAIVETEWNGVRVLVLSRHGSGHVLNPTQVPYRANIFALKQLGCTHVIASGAVGSLRDELRPRHLVIADQVIDKTHRRPGTFYEKAAVHVEFAEPFDPVLRQILVEAAKDDATNVHGKGCYVCMEGPAFSTRAESLMHRLWGGDLIGMTAMPEAKLAREAEIGYALVALVTDYDCWKHKPGEKADPFVLLNEIMANLQSASESAVRLMRRAVELAGSRRAELEQSPARQALKLGIWSDKAAIPTDEVERLRPLWGR
jgi:5'-methylthioadenosine phosphorylase